MCKWRLGASFWDGLRGWVPIYHLSIPGEGSPLSPVPLLLSFEGFHCLKVHEQGILLPGGQKRPPEIWP